MVGDETPLNSDMINTFIRPESARESAYIPAGSDSFRSTVRYVPAIDSIPRSLLSPVKRIQGTPSVLVLILSVSAVS